TGASGGIVVACRRGGSGRVARPHRECRQAFRNGQRGCGFSGAFESDRWLLRSVRRSFRRVRPTCPLGGRNELSSSWHLGRDRGDLSDCTISELRPGGGIFRSFEAAREPFRTILHYFGFP